MSSSHQLNSNVYDPNKKTIGICVPVYGNIPAGWFIHFMKFMMMNTKKFNLSFFVHEQQPVSDSRNKLIKQALKKGVDYVFFVDSDNLIPSDALERLLGTMEDFDADLVSGVYFSKDVPHYPVLRKFRNGAFWTIDDVKLGIEFEVGGCGMGCVLIKIDVFKTLGRPWFKFSHEKLGVKDIVLSEDLYFCKLMQEKGMRLMCNTGVISPHVGGTVDTPNFRNFFPVREGIRLQKEELEGAIMDFFKISRKGFDEKLIGCDVYFDEEFKNYKGKNPKDFWGGSEAFIFKSTKYHFNERSKFNLDLINQIKAYKESRPKFKDKPVRVLDFSCGIGQAGFMLAQMGCDVTLADLPGKSFDFVKFRFDRANLKYTLWDLNKDLDTEPYDVILCLDVFEYMDKKEFRKNIERVMNLKHKDTMVLVTQSMWEGVSILKLDREVRASLYAVQRLLIPEENMNTAEYWDKIWGREDGYREYKELFDRIIQFLKHDYQGKIDKLKVLDIGCGKGWLIRRVINEIPDIKTQVLAYGLDLSPEGIKDLNKKDMRVKTFVAKLPEENPLPEKFFDSIIATEFVEHLETDRLEKCLEIICNSLTDDGTFMITTPNGNHPKYRCCEHEQNFNPEEIKNLFNNYFNKVEIEVNDFMDEEFIMAFCKSPKRKVYKK